MKPTPAYVTNAAFEDYVEGWQTDDPSALTRLLGRAEHYVDLIGATRRITGADPVASISVTGNPTGGNFTVGFTINGEVFASAPIPYNATYSQVSAAILASTGQSTGARYPGTIITDTYSGPLPYNPVSVAFSGGAGSQPIPAGTVLVNTLTGGTNPQPVVTQVCPGAHVGKRFNPSALLRAGKLDALQSAVCAQAQYMLIMDDKLFDEAQYREISGPAFRTRGKLPEVAPKARRELALGGFAVGMGRATR